jgi:hypothetical protein
MRVAYALLYSQLRSIRVVKEYKESLHHRTQFEYIQWGWELSLRFQNVLGDHEHSDPIGNGDSFQERSVIQDEGEWSDIGSL